MKTILLLLALCGLSLTQTTAITGYVVAVRHPDIITYNIDGVATDTTTDVRFFRLCPDHESRVAAIVFLKSKGVSCDSILQHSFWMDKTAANIDSTMFFMLNNYTSLSNSYTAAGCADVGVVQ